MTLHAETCGDGTAARPLVLLHGFGGCAHVWRDVTARLPESLSVIAYDMPGHAGSVGSEAGGAGRLAKAILADLDQRGIAAFHLCGHSLGGATAALIALRAPERVASLTLLAPGGFGPDINAPALADWRDAAAEGELRAALQPMCAEGFIPSPDVIAALVEARNAPGAHASLSAIYRSMFVPDQAMKQGTLPLESLGTLACPVRLLWGTADEILPVSQSQGLPENIVVQRLEGAGHMLIEECPPDVAAFIMAAVTGATSKAAP